MSGWDDVNWRARWGCAYCICIIRFSISGKSLRKNQRSSRLNALLTSRTCSSITSSHSTQPSGIELMWVNGCLKMSNIRSLILFLSDTCVFPNLMQSSMVAGSYQLAGSSICNRLALGGGGGGGGESVLSTHVKLSLERSSSGAQRLNFSCVNTQNPTKPRIGPPQHPSVPNPRQKTEKHWHISRHHSLEMMPFCT